jgi:hypothetical protein
VDAGAELIGVDRELLGDGVGRAHDHVLLLDQTVGTSLAMPVIDDPQRIYTYSITASITSATRSAIPLPEQDSSCRLLDFARSLIAPSS